jgi:hypothetical protein
VRINLGIVMPFSMGQLFMVVSLVQVIGIGDCRDEHYWLA